MKAVVGLCILLCFAGASSAGELMRIVREHTAGLVAPGTYGVSLSTFPSDGLRFSLSIGVVRRVMLGLGYGGWNLTGLESPAWFEHVSLKAGVRLLDESDAFPGILAGFDNEPEPARTGGSYSRTSRDLYLSASKNFETFGGDMAFHLGLSLDVRDPVHAGSWIGMDKSLPGGFGAALEWDLATDEADSVRIDNGGGFLNGELFWESFGQVRVSLQFVDLLETGGESYRALGIDFLGIL